MVVQQLRGYYEIPKLFEEACVLGPAKMTVDGALGTQSISDAS